MKKLFISLVLIGTLFLCGCSLFEKTGPDLNSLPPLESEYINNDVVPNKGEVLLDTTLKSGLRVIIYDNGLMELSGTSVSSDFKKDAKVKEYLSSVDNVYIGDGVEKIGDRAFSEFYSLKSLTIGNMVNEIGTRAFYKCSSLEEVRCGRGLTVIGNEAFKNCSLLKTINFSNESSIAINANAFENCSALTAVELPEGTHSIGTKAFKNCTSMQYIVIPTSINEIGSEILGNTSALTEIKYHGTADQWTQISKASDWSQSAGTTTVLYNSI